MTLASARHLTRVLVGLANGAYQLRFKATSQTLLPELQRSCPQTDVQSGEFALATEAVLAVVLRRVASTNGRKPDLTHPGHDR